MQAESIQRAPNYRISQTEAAIFTTAIDDLEYDYLESAVGGRPDAIILQVGKEPG